MKPVAGSGKSQRNHEFACHIVAVVIAGAQLTRKTLKHDEIEKARAVSALSADSLGLSVAAKKLYDSEMAPFLTKLPEDQWNSTISNINQLMQFDDSGNILTLKSVTVGEHTRFPLSEVVVFKNNVYDEKLTAQMRSEDTSEKLAALQFALPSLVSGIGKIVLGTAVGVGGGTVTVSTAGIGAMVGVSSAGIAIAMDSAGALNIGEGLRILAQADHKVQYSFARDYDTQMSQHVGKTSESFGQKVEGKVKGKTQSFRVDMEPDADKIQVQSGSGKNSLKDIRIDPNKITNDDKSITDQLQTNDKTPRVKFSNNAKEQLVKNIRSAYNVWKIIRGK